MRTKVGHFIFKGIFKLEYPSKNSSIKLPTTYKEQVEIYKKRNLYIEDQEFAEKTLHNISYYRLSAYGLTLKDPIHKDRYKDEASFKKLLSLYEFDKRLRLLLLGVLETVEIAFRTHISYETAHKFGPLGYRNKENFFNEKYHQRSLDELEDLISKSRKGELFIQHHYKKYNGNIPIWVAMEITSFGFLSKFFRNLKNDLKKHIAQVYYDVPYFYLESWLQTLSNVRNVCAHYGRLYNKKLTFEPRLFKEETGQFSNSYIFAAIYITLRLLTKTEGSRFLTDIEALILEYEESIEFSCLGFPSNWRELLRHVNNAANR
jgi:abortive infection bacteriophage resistance protein